MNVRLDLVDEHDGEVVSSTSIAPDADDGAYVGRDESGRLCVVDRTAERRCARIFVGGDGSLLVEDLGVASVTVAHNRLGAGEIVPIGHDERLQVDDVAIRLKSRVVRPGETISGHLDLEERPPAVRRLSRSEAEEPSNGSSLPTGRGDRRSPSQKEDPIMAGSDEPVRAEEDESLSLADIDPMDEEQLKRLRTATLRKARRRIVADMERHKALGIVDDGGNLLTKELPPDMAPDSKTDV